MRLSLLLNRNAGTLRGLDPEQTLADLAAIFRARGHEVDAEVLEGDAAIQAIERSCENAAYDILIVGGGDGTVSVAAAAASRNGKTLGILPLGTMNFFARSLAIPLDISVAAEALATAEIADVDIGEVNGQLFVHHVSLGLHARMLLNRARLEYRSRLGKIWASCKAWWSAVSDPPNIVVHIRVDASQFQRRTAAVLVTNNPLGEGHIPYADDPRQGELGLYVGELSSLGGFAQHGSPDGAWQLCRKSASRQLGGQ